MHLKPRHSICFAACNLVWCGDGTCVANGTGHICRCNEDSANLFNMTGFACFKKCMGVFGKYGVNYILLNFKIIFL
jgi:hypothetical protein